MKVRNARNMLLGAVVSLLLLLVLPIGVLADGMEDGMSGHHHEGQQMTEMRHQGMQVFLGTNMFQMMFDAGQGYPFYNFNTSLNQGMFFLMFRSLTQYQDTNEDGIFDANETVGGNVSTLDLNKVTWDVVILNDSSQVKEFSFRSKAINVTGFENTSIEIINHFNGSTYIKFDVKISSWPFVEEATGLSLDFMLHWGRMRITEEMHMTESSGSMMPNAFMEYGADLLMESTVSDLSLQHGNDDNDGGTENGNMNNGTTGPWSGDMPMDHSNMTPMMPHEGMGTPLDVISNDTGIYLQDEGITLAFFKIMTEVIVDGELISNGTVLQLDTASMSSSMLSIRINYPKFNQSLVHDPTFGTSELALIPPAIDVTTLASFFSSLVDIKSGFIILVGLMSVLVVATYAFLSHKNRR